jgi:hypothetical protein
LLANYGRYRPDLVVIATVVALHEPIVTSGKNIFLMETTTSPAKDCLPITVQMLEMQLHQMRVVKIGRKVK